MSTNIINIFMYKGTVRGTPKHYIIMAWFPNFSVVTNVSYWTWTTLALNVKALLSRRGSTKQRKEDKSYLLTEMRKRLQDSHVHGNFSLRQRTCPQKSHQYGMSEWGIRCVELGVYLLKHCVVLRGFVCYHIIFWTLAMLA